jgi:hypothetical protein
VIRAALGDGSVNASRPPLAYRDSHECSACRLTPAFAATSVIGTPSSITANTA